MRNDNGQSDYINKALEIIVETKSLSDRRRYWKVFIRGLT